MITLSLNMLDPHVIASLVNIALIVVALFGISVINVTLSLTWQTTIRSSGFAVSWFLHAAVFFVLALTCNGNAGWCVQANFLFLSRSFDFSDWSGIIYSHGILTVIYYVFTTIHFYKLQADRKFKDNA